MKLGLVDQQEVLAEMAHLAQQDHLVQQDQVDQVEKRAPLDKQDCPVSKGNEERRVQLAQLDRVDHLA